MSDLQKAKAREAVRSLVAKLKKKKYDFMFLPRYQSSDESQYELDDEHRGRGYRIKDPNDPAQRNVSPNSLKKCIAVDDIPDVMPWIAHAPLYRDSSVCDLVTISDTVTDASLF